MMAGGPVIVPESALWPGSDGDAQGMISKVGLELPAILSLAVSGVLVAARISSNAELISSTVIGMMSEGGTIALDSARGAPPLFDVSVSASI